MLKEIININSAIETLQVIASSMYFKAFVIMLIGYIIYACHPRLFSISAILWSAAFLIFCIAVSGSVKYCRYAVYETKQTWDYQGNEFREKMGIDVINDALNMIDNADIAIR